MPCRFLIHWYVWRRLTSPSSIFDEININHGHNSPALGDSAGCYSFHNYSTLSDQKYALAISSVIEMTLTEKRPSSNSTVDWMCTPPLRSRCRRLYVTTWDYCMEYVLRELILQGGIQYHFEVEASRPPQRHPKWLLQKGLLPWQKHDVFLPTQTCAG